MAGSGPAGKGPGDALGTVATQLVIAAGLIVLQGLGLFPRVGVDPWRWAAAETSPALVSRARAAC